MTSCRLRGRAAGAAGGCALSRGGSASGLPIFAVSSFSMLESQQTGHESRPPAFWPSKSSAEANQPSNRCRSAQMSSNTITFALLCKHSTAPWVMSVRQAIVSRADPGAIGPHRAQSRRGEPDADDDKRRNAAHRPSTRHPLLRLRPALIQNRTRDHPDRKDDPQRDQYEIVQISQDRHEVRDEVNGAERVGHDARDQELRVPGRAGMARGEPKDESLALEVARAWFEAGEQRHRRGHIPALSSKAARRPAARRAPPSAAISRMTWRIRKVSRPRP